MRKLTKEELKAGLVKPILQCTEDEIRFAFHVMGFDLKDYRQEQGRVAFEIHYQRYFIIKVDVAGGVVTFSNQWIIFNDKENVHHISVQDSGKFIFILSTFINMFGEALLAPIKYQPGFIKGWSIAETPEEAKEYWMTIRETLASLQPAPKEAVADSQPAPANPENKPGKEKKIVS